jgi:hypothetical protein
MDPPSQPPAIRVQASSGKRSGGIPEQRTNAEQAYWENATRATACQIGINPTYRSPVAPFPRWMADAADPCKIQKNGLPHAELARPARRFPPENARHNLPTG